MTRYLLPLLVLAAAPLAAQQRQVRALRAAPDVAIRLWVPAGMVEVEGWDHDSVEVRATPTKGTRIVGGGTAAAMKFALENLRTSDTLLPSAQMRVFVPRGAKLWIKSTVAEVNARLLNGQLEVLQVTGPTRATDVGGVITVESIDGSVRLLRVDGSVRIRGGGGQATINGQSSGILDVSLVSGRLEVYRQDRDGSCPTTTASVSLNGRLETVSGPISFLGCLGTGGRMEIVTHSGSIDLQLRSERPPRVETTVDWATINERLRSGAVTDGRFTIRSFKGPVNAYWMSGI